MKNLFNGFMGTIIKWCLALTFLQGILEQVQVVLNTHPVETTLSLIGVAILFLGIEFRIHGKTAFRMCFRKGHCVFVKEIFKKSHNY